MRPPLERLRLVVENDLEVNNICHQHPLQALILNWPLPQYWALPLGHRPCHSVRQTPITPVLLMLM